MKNFKINIKLLFALTMISFLASCDFLTDIALFKNRSPKTMLIATIENTLASDSIIYNQRFGLFDFAYPNSSVKISLPNIKRNTSMTCYLYLIDIELLEQLQKKKKLRVY